MRRIYSNLVRVNFTAALPLIGSMLFGPVLFGPALPGADAALVSETAMT
jgi:hypothetical protein